MPTEPRFADDPLVEELVHDALRGWDGLLPPEVLDDFGTSLAVALLVHPDGQRLVRQARPDPVVQSSGDVEREPGAAAAGAGAQAQAAGTKRSP